MSDRKLSPGQVRKFVRKHDDSTDAQYAAGVVAGAYYDSLSDRQKGCGGGLSLPP